ncbi:FAD-dependent oxidoreductase [Ramlibacter tataouinensis]|uniref:Oxidoreductases-like protein n=1 Tax=Ramlibacter tataouinensis (strain ATCC BAA-407 / DSM 14655 / LMG 21543 / TTB310) TaxID=365046 RepID=F5Y0E7_RAMTT|nr:GMC family oxidoreductase [Ramlibacter tataouinensis]AEG92169.1 oxidoreductases-like protein [Ramlibacter tataouinensis TTB310]
MIEDANQVPAGTVLEADVCVVGGGAAGISLALALSGKGLSIVLLEAGKHSQDAPAQALYEGEVADEQMHSPTHRYRLRGLGGSTSLWGGRCMPYDPIDFEERSWVPHSGWPVAYEELVPYYVAANNLAEAGRYAYDAREAFPFSPPMIAGFTSDIVRTTGLERFSCPTHFGKRYARRLQLAPDIRVLRGAVCTGIRLQADGSAVRALDIATLEGNRFGVRARASVLATGGLETARLLLCSNDVTPAGVGNQFDVVGRYYQCHIAGNVGTLTVNGPPSDVRHGYEVAPDGVYCRRRLSIAPARQRQHQLLNAVARLHFPKITDPSHGSGVLSGLFLARKMISYEYGKRLADRKPPTLADYARHLFNVASDPLDTAAFLAHWVSRRTLAQRKFPSVILRNRINRFSLEVQSEQQPLATSRVQLCDRTDPLGMRRIRVDWRYSRDDIDSVAQTLDLMAAELARSGAGRFSYQRATLEEDLLRYGAYGGHHIGTARMGPDPRTSVVDRDCKLHAVSGLYVAGSAAFPTSSQANPTLTIIALSLRLADHLAQRLKPATAPALEVVA